MKKIFFFILTILSLQSFSQSKLYLRGDSVFIQSAINGELILLNSSRLNTGAYLKNTGNGRTGFSYVLDSMWVDGDSVRFRYGPTTISHAIGGGSGYVPTSRTLTINGNTYDLSANRSWSLGLQEILDQNNTATSDLILDGSLGVTQKISLAEQLSAPFTPSSGFGYLYYFDDSLYFKTPTTSFVLGRGSSGGGSGSGLNIYNSDSSLASNRTVNGNNKFLHIDSTLDFQLNVKKQLGRWGELYGTYNTIGGYSYYDSKELAGYEATNTSNNSNFLIEAQGANDTSYSKIHIFPDSIIVEQANHKYTLPQPTAGQLSDVLAKQSSFIPFDTTGRYLGKTYVYLDTTGAADTLRLAFAPEGGGTTRYDSIQTLLHTDSIGTATGNIAQINKRVWHYYDSSGIRVARRLAEDSVITFAGGGGGPADLDFTGTNIQESPSNTFTYVTGNSAFNAGISGTVKGASQGAIIYFKVEDGTCENVRLGFISGSTATTTATDYDAGFYISAGDGTLYTMSQAGLNGHGSFTVGRTYGVKVTATGDFSIVESTDDGATWSTFFDMVAEAFDNAGALHINIEIYGAGSAKIPNPKILLLP